jgi:hypothetical protein
VNARVVDRWILCAAMIIFAAVALYGMRIGNSDMARFGEHQFELFCGALLLLLNRELFGIKNGIGNGNGDKKDEIPAPALIVPVDNPHVVIPAVKVMPSSSSEP